ncbi:hypothetical protein GCM10011391_39770 [Pullulanibacillus camelliae]|uniref:Holin n=1 Tax=Pullulanibacillus camelliae TaxID=1707096 RepID=A0A8J3E025_9BACL|nr:hypothetical protein [Pullulanibacillus camelliae]GGE56902.1 hypothetical protein GCM10011391_39770 [Pullulanibacillus camelliae]
MDQLLSLHFGAYVALGFVLYAIRQATHIKNRYIPIVAIVLGVGYSWFESGAFNSTVLLTGIKYALYGVGTVATIKYALEKVETDLKDDKRNHK